MAKPVYRDPNPAPHGDGGTANSGMHYGPEGRTPAHAAGPGSHHPQAPVKNPAVGEPQGPSMTSYQRNRQRAGNDTLHDRIAAKDKAFSEGQARKQRLAPKKK